MLLAVILRWIWTLTWQLQAAWEMRKVVFLGTVRKGGRWCCGGGPVRLFPALQLPSFIASCVQQVSRVVWPAGFVSSQQLAPDRKRSERADGLPVLLLVPVEGRGRPAHWGWGMAQNQLSSSWKCTLRLRFLGQVSWPSGSVLLSFETGRSCSLFTSRS